MFEQDDASLSLLGAAVTTREIARQPGLWEDTFALWQDRRDAVRTFLRRFELEVSGPVRVVFCGAGSSAYVGDTVAPHLTAATAGGRLRFDAVDSTKVVASPRAHLRLDEPTLLVSLARSGESPESVAAVRCARRVVRHLRAINVTCNPEGRLAGEFAGDPEVLTLTIPGAHDRAFAMTGSYTSMTLLATLLFDPAPEGEKGAWVRKAAAMGRTVVHREAALARFLERDFDRIAYLGSGALAGLAREAQLKVLELAAGRTATSFDTSMGYRHGPKSFVDGRTLVFVLVSNDPYTRAYDLDILDEVELEGIAASAIALQQLTGDDFADRSFSFAGLPLLPDAYLALPFAMATQSIALLNAVRLGNAPDDPSPTGQVNRVVKGVTIHPLPADH